MGHRNTLGILLWCAGILVAVLLVLFLIANHFDALQTAVTLIADAARS